MAQQHLSGNLRLRQAWPKIEANTTELYERTEPASEEKAGLMSAEDKAKLDGIEDGAQVNQNAFAKVNDLEASSPSDTVTISGGTGITVTTNPHTKEVSVTATGDATPGPHGSSHTEFGSDPIPYATTTDGGLMSAEDKQLLVELEGLPNEVAAHKAETVTSVNAVAGYGADPTGATDTIAQLTAAATAAAGKTLFMPPGNYKIGSTFIVPDNTTIFAYGAKIFNTSNHITLLSLGNNVKIYGLKIEGAGNSTYNDSGRGIEIIGSYNSDLSVIDYRYDITIEDCHIHDIGGYGIYAKYAKNVKVRGCVIEDIGYAGVMGLSVMNMHVYGRTRISRISPGTAANAYGVAYTRQGAVTDLTQYPLSKDCSVSGCTIEDIPLWEALDTHGGENINFEYNTIRNTKVGIAIVPATGDANAPMYAPKNCNAIGNKIYGTGTGYGVVVRGLASDYAYSNKVANNTLIECGQQGQALSGAIYTEYTKGLVVSVNTLRNCYANGIHLFNENRSFSCTGNDVIDVQDNSFAAPACISFRSTNNDGVVSGNTLARDNVSLNTYVSEIGINFSSTTGIDVVVTGNKNNCAIQINGGNGPHIKYGVLGNNMYVFIGSGSPEGVVNAGVGSEYTDITTGLLYKKRSGTGNTGWVLSQTPQSGTTANRPTGVAVGTPYFDTTLGKTVWLKTAPSTWVDGAGTTV